MSRSHTNHRARAALRPRRGLSLPEVLISLAISASLLTAIAAAFSATASVIEQNDEVFRATQAARVTMLHLLTEIRQGEVDPNSTAGALHLVTSGSGSAIGDNRTYRLTGAPNNQLLLVTDGNATDPDYVLARNILATDATNDSRFDYETKTMPDGTRVVVQVTVTLVSKVGKNSLRLSGTASPREYAEQ